MVLVGHSLGGLYAASYALRYPRDVAAMVLVEPAFKGQTNQIARAVGPAAAARMEAANKQTIASLDRCLALARTGRLTLPAEQASDCLDNPPDLDPGVPRERNREAKSIAFEQALRSEYEAANVTGPDGQTQDDGQTEWSNATLGAMPMVVLTRGNSEALSGLSTDQIANAELTWRRGHDRLAALSTIGTNTVVPNSGHFVQLDQPEAVTKQVLRIMGLVRR